MSKRVYCSIQPFHHHPFSLASEVNKPQGPPLLLLESLDLVLEIFTHLSLEDVFKLGRVCHAWHYLICGNNKDSNEFWREIDTNFPYISVTGLFDKWSEPLIDPELKRIRLASNDAQKWDFLDEFRGDGVEDTFFKDEFEEGIEDFPYVENSYYRNKVINKTYGRESKRCIFKSRVLEKPFGLFTRRYVTESLIRNSENLTTLAKITNVIPERLEVSDQPFFISELTDLDGYLNDLEDMRAEVTSVEAMVTFSNKWRQKVDSGISDLKQHFNSSLHVSQFGHGVFSRTFSRGGNNIDEAQNRLNQIETLLPELKTYLSSSDFVLAAQIETAHTLQVLPSKQKSELLFIANRFNIKLNPNQEVNQIIDDLSKKISNLNLGKKSQCLSLICEYLTGIINTYPHTLVYKLTSYFYFLKAIEDGFGPRDFIPTPIFSSRNLPGKALNYLLAAYGSRDCNQLNGDFSILDNEEQSSKLNMLESIHNSLHAVLRRSGVKNALPSTCEYILQLFRVWIKSVIGVALELDNDYHHFKTKNNNTNSFNFDNDNESGKEGMSDGENEGEDFFWVKRINVIKSLIIGDRYEDGTYRRTQTTYFHGIPSLNESNWGANCYLDSSCTEKGDRVFAEEEDLKLHEEYFSSEEWDFEVQSENENDGDIEEGDDGEENYDTDDSNDYHEMKNRFEKEEDYLRKINSSVDSVARSSFLGVASLTEKQKLDRSTTDSIDDWSQSHAQKYVIMNPSCRENWKLNDYQNIEPNENKDEEENEEEFEQDSFGDSSSLKYGDSNAPSLRQIRKYQRSFENVFALNNFSSFIDFCLQTPHTTPILDPTTSPTLIPPSKYTFPQNLQITLPIVDLILTTGTFYLIDLIESAQCACIHCGRTCLLKDDVALAHGISTSSYVPRNPTR